MLTRLAMPTDQRLTVGERLDLAPEPSHKLARVLRAQPGDCLALFNAESGEVEARIAAISKKAVTVEITSLRREPGPTAPLTVAFAPLKKARLDMLVEKATEMGATRLQPLRTDFTDVSRINTDRLEEIARQAAEQTERLDVPQVAEELPLARWLAALDPHLRIAAAVEMGEAAPLARMAADGPVDGLLVGPEGGFSDAEHRALRQVSALHPVTLGPRILRAETAVIAAMAVIQAVAGDWTDPRAKDTYRRDAD